MEYVKPFAVGIVVSDGTGRGGSAVEVCCFGGVLEPIGQSTRDEVALGTAAINIPVHFNGDTASKEEFAENIRKTMEAQFAADSDFRFIQDLKTYLTKRVGELEFPEAMLKRIMKLNNPDKDVENIEKNFQLSLKELTWHLIKEQLSDQLEIKVEQPDVLETAKAAARMQFEQYGMMNVPDDVLTNYANKMLENKEQAEGLVSRAEENKIAQKAKDVVKLKKKAVTLAEFNKLYETTVEA